MTRAIMTLNDYSAEKTSISVSSQALTAANFDAQVTAWTALRTAIQALTLGITHKQSLNTEVMLSSALPTDPTAQREIKWLVSYQGDTSGKLFQVELGTADLTGGHLVANTDLADLTDSDWTAFITAFEAFVRSPDSLTETVTVVGARFVGRNI